MNRWRSRLLLSILATSALLVVSSVTAQASWHRDPVGEVPAVSAPKETSGAFGGRRMAASITCRTPVEGFTRLDSGDLYRLQDMDPVGPPHTLTEDIGRVGAGWGDSSIAWIASGGDGVVYALTWKGDLRWYRFNSTDRSWYPGSGTVVGAGFTPGTKIINMAYGGDGTFYVVRTNSQLVAYQYRGRLTGGAAWANGSGQVIGIGWTSNDVLAPNGDGTIYRQYQGNLYWYRHSALGGGTVTWQPRKTVGARWNFYDLLPAGNGVLYTVNAATGAVTVFRHFDPVGGSYGWSPAGLAKYEARADSFGITVDPRGCASS